ncbi:DUF2515 domain-containing protein [Halobacillus halophilus]|uniref:DUF2515 domain-containing protein n=1 Tax=Halobacillus halophilus TaxID=1570 RepID=UPI001CD48829|nr:DUF2515 domain-containing protein [Halobacillus halophilus]MCA1009579.1 DUF2515 domain-containing protein [Halobacillus halophilus]
MIRKWINNHNQYTTLKLELKNKLKEEPISNLSKEERKLIQSIRDKTKIRNKNNVTRTTAYLEYFKLHPEIHWCLLAHLVSRNAGWNMTDLKGEFLIRLLTPKEQNDFFLFLERGNWLIFQDAYPQLLLYEESKKQNVSLFHLLNHLNVSRFMEPFWVNFWKDKSSSLLTTALIINEQNYIESRVMLNDQYQKNVLHTILFRLQDVFDLNHILIPYETQSTKKVNFVGGTVHHFSSLEDRILLGKKLYHDLYSIKSRLKYIIIWAEQHPHTGSRHDFWPHLFTEIKKMFPDSNQMLPHTQIDLNKKSPRIYSPNLKDVWEDWTHSTAEEGDWFKDMKMFPFVKKKINDKEENVLNHYWETIEKLEIAVFAKKLFTRY